jgi:hypothetical protein
MNEERQGMAAYGAGIWATSDEASCRGGIPFIVVCSGRYCRFN